jgi:hypothetical protein
MTMRLSKLSHAKRHKILLAPEQARYGVNSVALEDTLGGKPSNDLPMWFLELRRVLSGKDGGCGIGPVFEGGMSFLDLSQH